MASAYTVKKGSPASQPDNFTKNDADVPDTAHRVQKDDFAIGLCKCGGSCCEAFWCHPCQISRQHNIVYNNKKGLLGSVCCLVCIFNGVCLNLVGAIYQCHIREKLRERYNMRENCCGDFCVSYCCGCCALNQTHWEMALRGDDPGATCSCGEVSIPATMR